jgi:hypothetical protein
MTSLRKNGHANGQKATDITSLELEQIDKTVGWLDAKYKGIALVEGSSLGAIAISVAS